MLLEGTTFDNTLHIITALLAFTLFIISLLSYYKVKRMKFLYVCSAFFLFAIKEVLTSVHILLYPSQTLVGISHLLSFAVLILFFIGVMK